MKDEGVATGMCPAMASSSLLPQSNSLTDALVRWKREATFGTCATGRYRCPYYAWGSGPPLVLVPGMASDAESFVMLVAGLADSFRCIAYDLPVGQADGACLSNLTHDDLVSDVFSLLDHLGIAESYVYGVSFGSTIALGALQRQPGRLRRGVLQSGFAHRPLAPAEVLLARLTRHWQSPLQRLPFRERLLLRCHYGPFADQPDDVWQFFLDRSSALAMSATAHRALLIHHLDLRPILSSIQQPVLLVSGDCDPLVGAQCEDILRQGLPQASSVQIRDCGHHAQFTHPSELAELVRRFLMPPCHA